MVRPPRRGADLTAPADGFISYVESQPDKIVAFAQYGVHLGAAPNTAAARTGAGTTPATDVSTFPTIQEGDSGEWMEYLDTMSGRPGESHPGATRPC